MTSRFTLRQLAEAINGASDLELNTLVSAVLGCCCARGFLEEEVGRAIVERVSRATCQVNPEAASSITKELLDEADDLLQRGLRR